jgi:hypothetical protein
VEGRRHLALFQLAVQVLLQGQHIQAGGGGRGGVLHPQLPLLGPLSAHGPEPVRQIERGGGKGPGVAEIARGGKRGKDKRGKERRCAAKHTHTHTHAHTHSDRERERDTERE